MSTIVTVTVHNNPDLECRRLTLRREYLLGDDFHDVEEFVRHAIRETEGLHRAAFPRNMSYVLPYTEVDFRLDVATEHTTIRHPEEASAS
jgi:hypothetical protein